MRLTQGCLNNPAGVAVAVAVIIILGLYSASRLPIQLFPDIERPQVGIWTGWRGASPQEVEAELIEPLEDVLQGIPGMSEMAAFANPGGAFISLTFNLDANMDSVVLDVISRLNRLPTLPTDADPPFLQLSGEGNSNESLIYLFVQLLPGNNKKIDEYGRFVEDVIRPRLETIEGVSGLRLENGAGGEEELQIVFDPYRAAQMGVSIPRIAQVAGRSEDASGGFVDIGRKKFTLRFAGRYSPEELKNLILEWREGRAVRLGDIAEIKVGRGPRNNFAYQNGNPALGVRVFRESGANVLATLERVKEEVAALNEGPAKENGLVIVKSFDPSVFINRAIAFLGGNLTLGLVLSLGILWLFMRQWRATFIVAATIPVCLLITFVILDVTGNTINVISLAGLAFALGMVFDAAIVVIENVIRLRNEGEREPLASQNGATQVGSALVASTITMVAIFVPVIFLKDVEGQLFRDLSLTIAIAVVISLVIAVTILPTMTRFLMPKTPPQPKEGGLSGFAVNAIMRMTGSPRLRMFWLIGLIGGSVAGTWLLKPDFHYLPAVKRDAIDAFIGVPTGTTVDVIDKEIAQVVLERLRPYMECKKEPCLLNYYFSKWEGDGGGGLGVRVIDESRLKEMEAIVKNEILKGFPDARVFASQGNLFGGFDEGGGIIIHLQSADAAAVAQAALKGRDIISEALGGADAWAEPDPELSQPELRIVPDDQRLNEVRMTRGDLAQAIRALGTGLFIGEHFDGTRKLDIILRSQQWHDAKELGGLPLATPSGEVVTLGNLALVEETVGPSGIRRIDRRRTTSLQVNLPEHMSLQEALDTVKRDVEPKLRALLPEDGRVIYGGSAGSLETALWTMLFNFLLALGLLFLVMAALFRSLLDSAMVTVTLPLATIGGMVALQVVNWFAFQPLDLLTMIGFIILLGLVVNNAILLVHQTRLGEGAGLSRKEAVAQSLRMRLRPIYASTLTNIVGTLPMVIVPAEGSEIYRGLAAAIVGGMAVSTVFTLIVLPCLLRLGEARGEARQLSVMPQPAE
jgi:multidrug efflux pump subunit AcrB